MVPFLRAGHINIYREQCSVITLSAEWEQHKWYACSYPNDTIDSVSKARKLYSTGTKYLPIAIAAASVSIWFKFYAVTTQLIFQWVIIVPGVLHVHLGTILIQAMECVSVVFPRRLNRVYWWRYFIEDWTLHNLASYPGYEAMHNLERRWGSIYG